MYIWNREGGIEGTTERRMGSEREKYSTSLKASFIASLNRTTVFSCANIIAKGFSND